MEQARPVPAPRRLYPELRPGNYENIELRPPSTTINTTNNIGGNTTTHNTTHNNNNLKKLNIDAENLHGNCTEKKLQAGGHSKLILQESNVDLRQPIYGPDANENVLEPEYAVPRPAPRQRLPPEPEVEEAVPLRAVRAAPQVPPKPLNIPAEQRFSVCSDMSTTSAATQGGGAGRAGEERQDREDSRYASNASLDCSESSQSGKFKSQSPGYVETPSPLPLPLPDDPPDDPQTAQPADADGDEDEDPPDTGSQSSSEKSASREGQESQEEDEEEDDK